MSASVKAAEFPATCANSACGRTLCGPVKHCPYCGVAVQPPISAKAPVAVAAKEPASPPPVVEPRAAALKFELPAAPAPAAPQPVAPAPAAPAAAPTPPVAPPADKPKGLLKKIVIGALVLALLAFYGMNQLGSRNSQRDLEQVLLAGQQCLRQSDYNCALDKAEQVLQKNSKDPAALSLLNRAKDGLKQVQRDKDLADQARQKEQDRKAQQDAADQRKRAEEQARREQEAKAAAQVQSIPAPATQPSTPPRSTTRIEQNNGAASMVGRSLNEARKALIRRDYQSAITVARLVLNMDPGNREAQNIINQATRQQSQALNRTTIE